MRFPPFVSVCILYGRCIFHTIRILLTILVGIIMKPKPSIWIPQKHPRPPSVLNDPKYGTHKYANVNGIKLHYVEKGDPSKKLIVFIHGFPEFWYSWRYQLEEFGKNYWCVALDLRGYGDSDKPNGVEHYKLDQITDDIKALIQSLGREKCILVGHDWGAVIGFHFVEKHMEMIEKYCMMDAPPRKVWAKLCATEWDQFSKAWYVAFFQMPMLPEYTFTLDNYAGLKIIGGNKITENFSENDFEAYKYTFAQKNALTCAINYYRANLKFAIDKTPPRSEKNPPGLFLLGEHDRYISKSSGPLAIKHLENLEFSIVRDADHFLQQTSPTVVNEILREFFAK